MFNILRYIILRWKLLKAIHATGKVYAHPSNRRTLDKEVSNLAWLIVKHKFGTPSLTLRSRAMMTKRKKVIRYIEIKGSMTLSDKDTVSFTIANNWGFGYRMVANVARDGKSLFATHGRIEHCFDVMRALGTK